MKNNFDNKPLISIVVPVYKVEKYLNRCVDSILKQTYPNLEIILVDDESPDACGDICDRYAQADSRIRVIHQKNKGLSGARNAGIGIATGDYIGFVDSDDYIAENMYESMLTNMLQNDAQIAICGRYYEFEDGKRMVRYKEEIKTTVMTNVEAIIRMNSFSSFDMAAWDKLYKRELFEGIRYPEGKLSEDYYVIYKLFDRTQKVVFNPEPLYFYVQRKNSISRNKKINYDFVDASKSQMDYLLPKYPQLEDVLASAYVSANMTVYNFHIKNKVKCPKEKKKLLKANVKRYLHNVMQNKSLSKIKKIQGILFVYCTALYNILFIVLRKIKRV